MKNFLVLYHCSLEDQMATNNQSQEEREKGMALWFAWKDKLGDKLVSFGSPTFNGARVNGDGSEVASPLELTGYSLIQAEDISEAKTLVVDHPHFTYGDSCKVEVHELMDMNM